MKATFEINGDFRVMDNSELVYTLTDNPKMKEETHKYEAMGLEVHLFDILDKLTPGRRRVAYAAIELYKRFKEGGKEPQQIRSSKDICNVMYPLLGDISTEELWVLFLNKAQRVIQKVRISCGGISETSADIRVIMKHAVLYGASAIALVHNHPSGKVRPSIQDDRVTEKLSKAAKIFNVHLVDHVIITNQPDKYYSYADEGNLL